MKIVRIVSLLLLLVIFLSACGSLNEGSSDEPDDQGLTEISVGGDGRFFRMYRHDLTGVMYLLHWNGSSCGLTVMLAPDGKPLLYDEWYGTESQEISNEN